MPSLHSGESNFLSGGGEMGALMRAHDWTTTSLGSPAHWPQPLRTTVRLLLNTGHPMYIWWGADGLCLYNDAYRQSIGPERHPGSLGRPAREVWSEIWDTIRPQFEQVMAGRGATWHENHLIPITRSGRREDVYWTYSYSPIDDETAPDRVGGILVVCAETTSILLLKRQLAEQIERQRRQFDGAPGFMAILGGPAHTFEFVNQAYTRLVGVRDYLGRALRDVVPEIEGQGFLELLDGVYRTGVRATLVDVPIRLRRPDDQGEEERFLSFVYEPIAEDDGAVTGIFVQGHDVTDAHRAVAALRELNDTLEARVCERTLALEQAQDALRQSQKLEAIGQLTGGVAHDFNNLLTVIRGSIDLLRRPGLREDRRERYMEAISDTVTRAAKLTGQLLAFARRQALQPEIFDVGRNVGAIVEMLATLTGSRTRIRTEFPEIPCYTNADPSQFDTSLINIAVNARDAMDGEGSLTICVKAVDAVPSLRSHPEVPGRFVAISITDTGPGIAADHLDRIFEPFFTTKEVGHGTGLGLSQVFGFVKQTGGEIQAESQLGQGTTFTLYLPASAAGTPAQAGTGSDVELADGHGTRILVVEDNDDVGAFAASTLEELGYGTTLATDGPSALAMLEASRAGFDVVFSDVIMPGMSGIELGREIRRLYADLPVVLTSGYSHVLAEDGTCGFELLQKPYSMDELSRVLRKMAAWRHNRLVAA